MEPVLLLLTKHRSYSYQGDWRTGRFISPQVTVLTIPLAGVPSRCISSNCIISFIFFLLCLLRRTHVIATGTIPGCCAVRRTFPRR